MKAAIYARVSTDQCLICRRNRRFHDEGKTAHSFKGQDTGVQIRELLDYCKRRKWKLLDVYTDPGWSGSKESRPQFDRLMKDAKRRRMDVIVVSHFDRFARSLKQLVDALEEFNTLDIQFVSLHEQIDTTSPVGKFTFHIFAAVAEFERSLIRQRVISGLDKVRNTCQVCGRELKSHLHAGHKFNPKILGRPRIAIDDRIMRQIHASRSQGESWRTISAKVGITHDTLRRAFLEAANGHGDANTRVNGTGQVVDSKKARKCTKAGA